MLPDAPKLLVAFSAGQSSAALLHMLTEFSFNQRKATFPDIEVVYIDQSTLLGNPENVDVVTGICTEYGLPLTVIPLQNILKDPVALTFTPSSLELSLTSNGLDGDSLSKTLSTTFEGIKSLTSKEDLLYLWTHQLILNHASTHGFNVLMMADNCSLISQKVIAALSKGRGLDIPSMVCTESTINSVTLIRPMRDMSAKEIGLYVTFNHLKTGLHRTLSTGLPAKASIDRLTLQFMTGLDADFPSTSSTVTRTAAKVAMNETLYSSTCPFCTGLMDTKVGDKKVVDRIMATLVSFKSPNGIELPKSELNITHVCYGCQNIMRDISTIPVPSQVSVRLTESQMRHQISDLLL